MQKEDFPHIHKIKKWSNDRTQCNSIIVQIYLNLSEENNGVDEEKFKKAIKEQKVRLCNLSAMQGNGSNYNGVIFTKKGTVFVMPDEIYEEVLKHFCKIPLGVLHPTKRKKEIEYFERDPEVKAWVLKNSNGICEGCGEDAPFKKDNGELYLEVHHVKTLADGGSDTVQNAVALCPDCHRRCHYSIDKDDFKQTLYKKIKRLIKE